MHLQTLFVVAFAVICGIQCAPGMIEHLSLLANAFNSALDKDDGWDFEKQYKLPEDDDEYDDKPYNRKSNGGGAGVEDRDYTKDRKSSKYNDDDDDDTYDNGPSYKDSDNYDDDDDSYGKRPSYKGSDKYDDDDDYDDYKPKRRQPSKYENKPKDLGHMNIYLREPSKDGKRRKPKRFRFPTARYEREHFPRTFGPLISFMPWVPIFADRLTKQTIIYSPTGGVYILPPVINFYGKLTSVAQLVASGYASLVSSGAPPPPAVDVAPLVQPGPVVGPGVPTVDTAKGGFKGGVRTEFRSFPRPNYPGNYEDKSGYSQKDDYPQPRGGY
ncbi:unnamed protein product [Adineta ricciae]|uniref:Uncharacterized protein n=1 Tax=Adineta ricciae TaxID=249248 RepID=A0A814PU84_ADIRI|nr:unnamed protein product [Adineta ricciae]